LFPSPDNITETKTNTKLSNGWVCSNVVDQVDELFCLFVLNLFGRRR